MKKVKILSLVMVAVMAVVMIVPMEAKAADPAGDFTVGVREGLPVITGVDSGYHHDNTSGYQDYYVSYEVVVPVTVLIQALPYGSYLNGRIVFGLQSQFNIIAGTTADYSIVLSEVWTDLDNVHCFFQGVNAGACNGYVYGDQWVTEYGEKVFVDFDDSIYVSGVSGAAEFFVVYCKYIVYLEGAVDGVSSNGSLASVTSFVSVVENSTIATSEPVEDRWLISIGENIVSAISSLQTNIGNWFTTQWTFGRQWTDDIIDAIVGQGGGSTINSAQEKLDQQLNDFGTAEDQIADQVVDKVEIPSLVLNDSQATSLTWVIGMMNSWYLKFDELQVIFSSILFFGIIGVILFGRRSL